jgi:hypothetical protein
MGPFHRTPGHGLLQRTVHRALDGIRCDTDNGANMMVAAYSGPGISRARSGNWRIPAIQRWVETSEPEETDKSTGGAVRPAAVDKRAWRTVSPHDASRRTHRGVLQITLTGHRRGDRTSVPR